MDKYIKDGIEALCRDCIWYSPFENAPGGECVNPEYDNGRDAHVVNENNWCFEFAPASADMRERKETEYGKDTDII